MKYKVIQHFQYIRLRPSPPKRQHLKAKAELTTSSRHIGNLNTTFLTRSQIDHVIPNSQHSDKLQVRTCIKSGSGDRDTSRENNVCITDTAGNSRDVWSSGILNVGVGDGEYGRFGVDTIQADNFEWL